MNMITKFVNKFTYNFLLDKIYFLEHSLIVHNQFVYMHGLTSIS